MLGVTATTGRTHDQNYRTKHEPSTSLKARSLEDNKDTTNDTNNIRTRAKMTRRLDGVTHINSNKRLD